MFLRFLHFSEKLKPKYECKFDWIGIILYYAHPVTIFCTLGFSLFPIVMPPEYNYVNSFIIDIFNFESEKTKFWLLFRFFYFIVVCAEAFVSIGTCFLHAVLCALILYLNTSWLSHLETVTCSMRAVNKFLDFNNILKVSTTIFQLLTRFLAPLFAEFSFIVILYH